MSLSKYGNPLIDYQRSETVRFCGEPTHNLYFHLRSYYPDLLTLDRFSSIEVPRNRLVHGYFEVDLEKVWETIHGDLPSLIEKLECLIPPEN